MASCAGPAAGSGVHESVGSEMHKRIGPELWSVTREDLRCLRNEVETAIQKGEIVPDPVRDPFDVTDREIGPSIYTVNKQFIKPVTAKAGNMSWALMKNRDGSTCDVFVTHAWQEGIFEFIDKVLASWPDKKYQGAYCCMLSNPQNLDISDMIKGPKDSPFARALLRSQCMLVVSNRKTSIYSRLWCAYEAYLAYSWKKDIYTAASPVLQAVLQALKMLSAFFIPGALVGVVLERILFQAEWTYTTNPIIRKRAYLFVIVVIPIACGSILQSLHCPRLTTINNRCGAFVFGLLLVPYLSETSPHVAPWRLNDIALQRLSNRMFMMVVITAFCVLAEVDRVLSVAHYVEKAQLRRNFETRTIRDAQCSYNADKENIWAEIGDEAKRVDDTLEVVISAGMSTPSLRMAARYGVDVKDAGYINYSGLLATWGVWFQFARSPWIHNWGDGRLREDPYMIVSCIWWLPPVLWVFVWLALPIDCKAFAAKATMKSIMALFIFAALWQGWMGFLPGMLTIICAPLPGMRVPDYMQNSCSTAISRWPLLTFVQQTIYVLLEVVAFLCCAGPGRIASIPFCGPGIVQFIYTCACTASTRNGGIASDEGGSLLDRGSE